MTTPARIRSARFPSAPPARRPTATHIPGSGRVAPEEEADQAERRQRYRDEAQAGAAGEAKGDTAVVGQGQAQRPQNADVLAGYEVSFDCRLGCLVGDDHKATERAGQAPSAGGLSAHPEIRGTTSACSKSSTITPSIGLRSSANPPPPIGGRKRRKRLR